MEFPKWIINMPEQTKRPSLTTSLEDRYKSAKTIGKFDAKVADTNNMMLGLIAPFGYSQKSVDLTIESGFTTNMGNNRRENFKDSVLTDDNSTICKSGFNNTKYHP